MEIQKIMPNNWRQFLSIDVVKKADSIEKTLDLYKLNGVVVFPEKALRYSSLKMAPEDVKVIIIGQDPYHGDGEATGLSFSVPKTRTIPSSLRNIYNELHDDIGFCIPSHGDLQEWTGQGVLLLNRYLSVERNMPKSHRHFGWHVLTNEIIHKLVTLHQEKLVIVLLGHEAAKSMSELSLGNCCVIKTSHPSSLHSAYKKGFQGSRIFSRINNHLNECGRESVNWAITG